MFRETDSVAVPQEPRNSGNRRLMLPPSTTTTSSSSIDGKQHLTKSSSAGDATSGGKSKGKARSGGRTLSRERKGKGDDEPSRVSAV